MTHKKSRKISVGLGMQITRYRDGTMKFGFQVITEEFYNEQLLYLAFSLFKIQINIGYCGHEEE